MAEFTYPEVGATRAGPLPPGYNHLTYRTRIGPGAFRAATEAVVTWRMHRGTGLRIDTSAPRAAPGIAVTTPVGFGPLAISAPCQVVWTVDDEDRAGFAYGTLPGHPESGEESFVVSRRADEAWLTVTSFSRPARWYTRAAGPVVPFLQREYARRCGRALRHALR